MTNDEVRDLCGSFHCRSPGGIDIVSHRKRWPAMGEALAFWEFNITIRGIPIADRDQTQEGRIDIVTYREAWPAMVRRYHWLRSVSHRRSLSRVPRLYHFDFDVQLYNKRSRISRVKMVLAIWLAILTFHRRGYFPVPQTLPAWCIG